VIGNFSRKDGQLFLSTEDRKDAAKGTVIEFAAIKAPERIRVAPNYLPVADRWLPFDRQVLRDDTKNNLVAEAFNYVSEAEVRSTLSISSGLASAK